MTKIIEIVIVILKNLVFPWAIIIFIGLLFYTGHSVSATTLLFISIIVFQEKEHKKEMDELKEIIDKKEEELKRYRTGI